MNWSRIWEFYLAEPELAVLLVGNLVFALGTVGLIVTALVLRVRNDQKAAGWVALEARWSATALDVVGGGQPATQLWALVPDRDRIRFVNFLLRFARRLVGPERRVVDDLAAPYLDLLLPQLTDRRPERRARAVQTLSTLGRRRYALNLVRALDDPSPLVAMVAARALARRESPDFAMAILRRMHRFDTWRASFLSSMLAAIGPAVAPALRQALGDPEFHPRVRAVAADALRELNDYPSAELAAQLLLLETDRDLIAASLSVIAHMGQPKHVEAVRHHTRSPEPIIRARAIQALGQVARAEDIPTLTAALEDPSPWVALRAAEALRDARALPAVSILDQTNHPRAELVRQLLAGNLN
jgi:hypothetical protein